VSDAVGALDAAGGTRMIGRPGVGRVSRSVGETVVAGWGRLLMFGGVWSLDGVAGCGREAARLTYGLQARFLLCLAT
jgi:hypothetical protein